MALEGTGGKGFLSWFRCAFSDGDLSHAQLLRCLPTGGRAQFPQHSQHFLWPVPAVPSNQQIPLALLLQKVSVAECLQQGTSLSKKCPWYHREQISREFQRMGFQQLLPEQHHSDSSAIHWTTAMPSPIRTNCPPGGQGEASSLGTPPQPYE